MGCCESKYNKYPKIIEQNNDTRRKDQLCIDNVPMSLDVMNEIKNSICKIKITSKSYGTGFFMTINSKNYLITNYHVINENIKNTEIELSNKQLIKLDLNNRIIKYIKQPKDITIIQIHLNEINNIQYLNYDLNYIMGYNQYLNMNIISLGYPKFYELAGGSGIIKEIDKYEFYHNIPTKEGSSGSPIMLPESKKVIGIHKQADNEKNLNVGTFIGEIFNEIDLDNSKENQIVCIYNKKDKETRIKLLHDFKNDFFSNYYKLNKLYNEAKNNINENNIDIYINNKKIKFNYKYESNEIGRIKVKFKFNKLLTSTGWMFFGCKSLESVDLSSFNSNNVINMSFMFYHCDSLELIDLSSFNTSNVTNMIGMFSDCKSLKSIDLSSFNTNNNTNMSLMFSNCSSLGSIDLSLFNTNKVTNMSYLFFGCKSLKTIDLSSFNTNNVTNMKNMFSDCKSLESIDLSSFNTNNNINMKSMFDGCDSLQKENIRINENGKKILDEYLSNK